MIKGVSDKFYFVSAKDGKVVRQIDFGFGLDTMPVTPIEVNNKVIFGSKNGNIYLIDDSYNYNPLLFMGTARIHTVQHIGDNIFAASNMDGEIVAFRLAGGSNDE
jgi:hypothetical protein